VLSDAEETIGLHLLYRLRGAEKPKADVVVVALDRASAKSYNLRAAPNKWPRVLHARLLERLMAHKAVVVAFDLHFSEPQQSSNDQALAAAIRRAGNVILTQPIERKSMRLTNQNGVPVTHVNIDRMLSAIPMLAEEAFAQAPFPLPKVPIKLNQYWNFSPGSGDVPTLPVVVMHAYAMDTFERFVAIVKKVHPMAKQALPLSGNADGATPRVTDIIRPLYLLFKKDPTLGRRVLAELERDPSLAGSGRTASRIKAFIRLYGSGPSGYLNLYGPPGTIETISYHQALAPAHSKFGPAGKELSVFNGKAVFIGQTESDWFKAHDGFYTAFSLGSGVDISGVEIAATAFANLMEGKAVHPFRPAVQYAVLLVWGVLCALVGLHFSTAASAAALLLLNGAYCGLAYAQFKSGGIWYPLVIPVLVQSPAACIVGLIWKYRKVNAERRNIREAFGYYLPEEVVGRLASNVKALRGGGQVLYSICLFTDAENYTTLSETMDPGALTDLMNAYYNAIFKPIKDNGGIILQVIGDSVLALWTAPQPQTALQKAACQAAIGITRAVRQFNSEAGNCPLPTRIGMHAGEILLGNIGAMDHFEYRPVGDIVNTASRLEGLNKYLGTRTLASEDAFVNDNGCISRPVGQFVFKGKSQAVRVHEIVDRKTLPSGQRAMAHRRFASGLRAFESRNWDEAEQWFDRVLQIDKSDGPAQFYRGLCRRYRQAPPAADWDGAVHMQKK
jgi:adenylate cyclase